MLRALLYTNQIIFILICKNIKMLSLNSDSYKLFKLTRLYHKAENYKFFSVFSVAKFYVNSIDNLYTFFLRDNIFFSQAL